MSSRARVKLQSFFIEVLVLFCLFGLLSYILVHVASMFFSNKPEGEI